VLDWARSSRFVLPRGSSMTNMYCTARQGGA
jgi:hypothetical protein